MIMNAPQFYPDELLFSFISRLYCTSAIPKYFYFKEKIFGKNGYISAEFGCSMTEELKSILGNDLKNVIYNHTMIGNYIPFVLNEKYIEYLTGNYEEYYLKFFKNISLYSRNKQIRYCPLCAESDRSQYSEAYWHRAHQLNGTKYCPTHHCQLYDTDIRSTSRFPFELTPAELIIPRKSIVKYGGIDKEHQLNGHMFEYLNMQMPQEFSFKDMLNDYYNYFNADRKRNCFPFEHTLSLFLREIDSKYIPQIRIKRILEGRFNTLYEIATVLMALNITPEKLKKIAPRYLN